MELKPGYKQTDVGVIPEDWEVQKLDDLCNFKNGKAHEDSIKKNGNYVVVNSKFISTNGKVRKYSNKAFMPAKNGDVLIVMSDVPNGRAIARSFIVTKDNQFTVNQRIGVIKPHLIPSKFLFYKLNRNKYYLGFDDGVKQTNLRREDMLSCPISLPPTKAEQEAIAGALSDADELIASLEQLIEKKRMIKQGAMQELLTGKKRLPGFQQKPGYKQTEVGEIPEDWEVKALNEVLLSFQNGYGFSAAGYETTGVPIVTMAQIGLDGTFVFNEDKLNYWNARSAESMKSFFLSDGDVIIAMTDVTPDKNLIGRLAITKIQDIALLNQRVGLLRLNKDLINKHYLAPLSGQKTWRNYCMASATLGVQANLGTKAIKAIPIPFPSKREQDAIASVLSDMDAEIEVLQKKLEKARKIKAGMMHNLLTGTIRLV